MTLDKDDIKAIASEVVKILAPMLPQTAPTINITDHMHIKELARQAMNRPRRKRQ